MTQQQPKRTGISIVVVGCRFPEANGKDMFRDLLEQERSSIGASCDGCPVHSHCICNHFINFAKDFKTPMFSLCPFTVS